KSLDSAVRQLELFAEIGFQTEHARTLAALVRKQSPQLDVLLNKEEDLAKIVSTGRTQVPNARSLPVLLHLSDIHFGAGSKDGKSIAMHRFYDGENSQPLVKHLVDEFATKGSHFSYSREQMHLIISGDLTYTGADREYD